MDNKLSDAGNITRNVLIQELNKVNTRRLVLYGVIGCSFQTGTPTGQLITRVKAFIEML